MTHLVQSRTTSPDRPVRRHACVIPEPSSCIFFDWGDSCISHPLIDVAKFARFHPAEWDQIKAVYFDSWKPVRRASQLHTSFAAAKYLERIHELRRYVQVYPKVEPWLGHRVLKWIGDLVHQLAAMHG